MVLEISCQIYCQIHKFKESPKCPRNTSCRDFETFRPRNPGLISWTTMTGAWNRCSDVTVAIASRGWDGVTWLAEWIWDKVTSLTDGIWNGGSWMTERVWNGATWLTDGIWKGITWLADVIWNGVIWAADGVWNGVTWLDWKPVSSGQLCNWLPGQFILWKFGQ